MHYLCLASCLAVNRPDQIMFHYQNEPWGEYWDRIRPHLTLMPIEPDDFIASYEYSDQSLNAFRYAHLADIARLEVLARHGGVYADMDTLFVSPLPPELFEHPFTMGHERVDWTAAANHAGGSLCNAWMMGEPGAAFVQEWLKRTKETFDGSWNAHSTLLPYILSREHANDIHVEPQRSFFHFDWDRRGIETIFQRLETDLDGIHSIHLWCHMWWDAKRRDTSNFYAGRLTPAYVRHARTTYAAISRPFLAPDLGRQDRLTYGTECLRHRLEDVCWAALTVLKGIRRKLVSQR